MIRYCFPLPVISWHFGKIKVHLGIMDQPHIYIYHWVENLFLINIQLKLKWANAFYFLVPKNDRVPICDHLLKCITMAT